MSAAVCPYCRTPVEPDEVVACEGCGTVHHAECLAENEGCTVFGCTHAPAVEPKLTIGATEMNSVGGPVAPPPPMIDRPRPAPPPMINAPARPAEPERPIFSSLGYGGHPMPLPAPYHAPYSPNFAATLPPHALQMMAKNRTLYLLMGILLGAVGAHSFYAGYTKKGSIQLAISLFTCGLGSIAVWIWAIIDVCTVTEDRDGIPFIN